MLDYTYECIYIKVLSGLSFPLVGTKLSKSILNYNVRLHFSYLKKNTIAQRFIVEEIINKILKEKN